MLGDLPPYRTVNLGAVEQDGGNRVRLPEVQLYCDECKGMMRFRPRATFHPATESGLLTLKLAQFACKHCDVQLYGFALLVERVEFVNHELLGDNREVHWHITKVGQLPAFGPQIPAKLVALIGPEKDLFFKGRRCESQGLGIGAFGYYRRVIESQRDRLLDGIAKVIERTKPDTARVELLMKAKAETQFTRSMELAEDALPDSLLIEGLNPLKVLHSVYSKGLHTLTDDDCLALASATREVLAALAERMAEVTSDHASLTASVRKLNSTGGAQS